VKGTEQSRRRWDGNPDREFTEADRKILAASDVDGSSHAEVARSFGVTEYYVNQLRRDARAEFTDLGITRKFKATGRKHLFSLGLKYFAMKLGAIFGDSKIGRMLGIHSTTIGKWRAELGIPSPFAKQPARVEVPATMNPPSTTRVVAQPNHPPEAISAWGDWADVEKRLARRDGPTGR